MAQYMDLDVIAEGVETTHELSFLRTRGCRKFQGYYFSQPLHADEFTAMLNDQASRLRAC